LFSHLYLRGHGIVLVIIDEPELSLSVTWQQQLLPDILETGKCGFLAAVTHSPFIFDNALDSYAVNLKDCISETKNVSSNCMIR
jgi:predicted ATPase